MEYLKFIAEPSSLAAVKKFNELVDSGEANASDIISIIEKDNQFIVFYRKIYENK